MGWARGVVWCEPCRPSSSRLTAERASVRDRDPSPCAHRDSRDPTQLLRSLAARSCRPGAELGRLAGFPAESSDEPELERGPAACTLSAASDIGHGHAQMCRVMGAACGHVQQSGEPAQQEPLLRDVRCDTPLANAASSQTPSAVWRSCKKPEYNGPESYMGSRRKSWRRIRRSAIRGWRVSAPAGGSAVITSPSRARFRRAPMVKVGASGSAPRLLPVHGIGVWI